MTEASERDPRDRPAGSPGGPASIGTMVVLAVSPHPDDVEIGCFATLARLSAQEPVVIAVMTSGEVRGNSAAREQEARESAGLIGATIEFLRFPDGSLTQNAETVGKLRALMQRSKATTVFCPYSSDSHQDHAATYGIVTASAAHAQEILLYESPSTVDFRPDVYYEVSSTLPVKLRALAAFRSQHDRPYLAPELVEAQARYYALRLHRAGQAFEAFSLFRAVR